MTLKTRQDGAVFTLCPKYFGNNESEHELAQRSLSQPTAIMSQFFLLWRQFFFALSLGTSNSDDVTSRTNHIGDDAAAANDNATSEDFALPSDKSREVSSGSVSSNSPPLTATTRPDLPPSSSIDPKGAHRTSSSPASETTQSNPSAAARASASLQDPSQDASPFSTNESSEVSRDSTPSSPTSVPSAHSSIFDRFSQSQSQISAASPTDKSVQGKFSKAFSFSSWTKKKPSTNEPLLANFARADVADFAVSDSDLPPIPPSHEPNKPLSNPSNVSPPLPAITFSNPYTSVSSTADVPSHQNGASPPLPKEDNESATSASIPAAADLYFSSSAQPVDDHKAKSSNFLSSLYGKFEDLVRSQPEKDVNDAESGKFTPLICEV